MIEVITQTKHAKVWINKEYCHDSHAIQIMMQETIKAHHHVKWENCSYALELKLLRHCSNYAKLQIHYQYEDTDQLLIRVVNEADGEQVEDALCFSQDIVYTGLPKEYGEAIMHCAIRYFQTHACASGKLTFFAGAHGVIGSSQHMFAKVAFLLLTLIYEQCVEDENCIETSILHTWNF